MEVSTSVIAVNGFCNAYKTITQDAVDQVTNTSISPLLSFLAVSLAVDDDNNYTAEVCRVYVL